jgi:hypothetical protein
VKIGLGIGLALLVVFLVGLARVRIMPDRPRTQTTVTWNVPFCRDFGLKPANFTPPKFSSKFPYLAV